MQQHPDPVIHAELVQKVEWKSRLRTAIIGRQFDDETLCAMLEAGLDQSHSEGLLDAAAVCQGLADSVDEANTKRTAAALARAIRNLDAMNRDIPTPGQASAKSP